uniref:Uncharacterized protein n=1 Tax=viral metagenome TaxID=1070528 RepID=A0A6C0HM31_9ZZZZ
MPLAVIRGAGKKSSSKQSKNAYRRKHMFKSGGAIYGFDLADKIGGQAARRSLYKTTDSDCPPGGVNDTSLGFSYNSSVKLQTGGTGCNANKQRVQTGSGCGCKGNSTRTPRNNLETQRGGSHKYRRTRSKKNKQSHKSHKSHRSRKH